MAMCELAITAAEFASRDSSRLLKKTSDKPLVFVVLA